MKIDEITKEEAKAFADDLAFVQRKHGIVVDHLGERPVIRKINSHENSSVFLEGENHDVVWFFSSIGRLNGSECLQSEKIEHVVSADFDNMSAHDMMTWKRNQQRLC